MGLRPHSTETGCDSGLPQTEPLDDGPFQACGPGANLGAARPRQVEGKVMRGLALAAIRLYQVTVSPYLPGVCRHTPSCSLYAHEAILRHGVVRGFWLGIRRLSRCRPLGTSGYDPVP